MNTVVFVGPTLAPDEVRAVLPRAEVLGPAACGDVLRASGEGPVTMAIIDGFFEHRLPVWHKEILWALSRGCRVYGASSMGALRAVELAAFGMIGVGQIFEWYRDGVLEDDDEVAVAHEDGAGSYRTRSDAMVNVRATLARAVASGVLPAEAESTIIAAVKSVPYPQRDLRRTLAGADLAERTRQDLTVWLQRHGLFDQKRADALALLQRVASDHGRAGRAITTFSFSYTEVFHELVRSVAPASVSPPATAAPAPGVEDLLEELQLCGRDQLRPCWLAALQRALARALVRPADDDLVRQAVLAELPAVLQERGTLLSLAARAATKSSLLASDARPAVRTSPADLISWHFAVLGHPVPDDLDTYAEEMGFPNQEALVLAIARERWYLDHQASGASVDVTARAETPTGRPSPAPTGASAGSD